jgi:hypothetical protein
MGLRNPAADELRRQRYLNLASEAAAQSADLSKRCLNGNRPRCPDAAGASAGRHSRLNRSK